MARGGRVVGEVVAEREEEVAEAFGGGLRWESAGEAWASAFGAVGGEGEVWDGGDGAGGRVLVREVGECAVHAAGAV